MAILYDTQHTRTHTQYARSKPIYISLHSYRLFGGSGAAAAAAGPFSQYTRRIRDRMRGSEKYGRHSSLA